MQAQGVGGFLLVGYFGGDGAVYGRDDVEGDALGVSRQLVKREGHVLVLPERDLAVTEAAVFRCPD